MKVYSGMLLRSQSGRHLEPVPKLTKSFRNNLKKFNDWLIKQYYEEIVFLGGDSHNQYLRFECNDKKKLSNADRAIIYFYLFGTPTGFLPCNIVHKYPKAEQQKQAKAINSLLATLEFLDEGTIAYGSVKESLRKMYYTILLENEMGSSDLVEKCRINDETEFDSIVNAEIVNKPRLDLGFKVFKLVGAGCEMETATKQLAMSI